MAFDMQREIVRHQEGWKGFAMLIGGSLAGILLLLAILALTLL